MFSNLTLCFYPQPATSKLSKLKSASCVKRGATVVPEMAAGVTHVLVARNWDNKQFWDRYAQSGCSGVPVLNSEWCSACIEQNRLVEYGDFLLKNRAKPLNAKRENAVFVSEKFQTEKFQTESEKLPPGGNQRQRVLDVLHELAMARKASGEEYSSKAYMLALKQVETRGPQHIASSRDVAHLVSPRIGKLIDKICRGELTPAIVSKARVRPNAPTETEILELFSTVYGVGKYTAKKLYRQGYRTLQDLYKVLDRNAQLSIEHHAELIERMSRTEVTQHYMKTKELALKIDSSIELHCMGSFRRGQPDCGDIDIILTKNGASKQELNELLSKLISSMKSVNFATHTFQRGADRWLGATQVCGRWRRMDILLVPTNEMGAALLYYTGSGEFNRQMRTHAKLHNLKLNHNGLFKSGELLESRSERRIFELLNLEYVEPEKR